MRLMKYSSPSCHSSRSLAPYIIQEGEGGCIEGRGTNGGQGRRQKKDERSPGVSIGVTVRMGWTRGGGGNGNDGRLVGSGRQCWSSVRVEDGTRWSAE